LTAASVAGNEDIFLICLELTIASDISAIIEFDFKLIKEG
jgi:hypothetical protein